MSKYEIILPAYCHFGNLDRLQKIWNMAVQNQSESYHVDLSRVHVFTPFTACYIVALVLELLKISHVNVTVPDDENARHQIDYLGVKSFFTKQPIRRSKRVRAVPMAHLSEPNYDKAGELSKLTAESLDLPKNHFYLVHLCLKELLQNSFEHGESGAGTFVCAYGVKNRGIVRICTLDRGIGILSHLSSNPSYSNLKSHSDAIKLAIQKSVSGNPKKSRGLGLYYISHLLADAGGELSIASGNAVISLKGTSPPTEKTLSFPYEGTIVHVEFKAKKDYSFSLDDLEE